MIFNKCNIIVSKVGSVCLRVHVAFVLIPPIAVAPRSGRQIYANLAADDVNVIMRYLYALILL